MVLGFGFNKAKVLASAEKFVQQGRLQNAIADYEKVLREDPKDLTVMNTIGDLYARVGQTDKAIQYFKRVGDSYAGDGFTVKAIAMYKKLTKLDPRATECVLRLAELYSQQGLYNDARAQYLGVADHYLRAGGTARATQVFQRMLELDPDNPGMQAKLADLYVKLGKKEDARNIFFNAAESLFRRGALKAADEALARVLALDSGYVRALMLRGQIAAESDQPAAAVELLEKVPDLDSQPDALRALLRAYLRLNNIPEAMPIAGKLLAVHNDSSGIVACADALIAADDCEAGLRLYHQHADRLLGSNPEQLLEKLHGCIARINNNACALELLRGLFQKAGEVTHLNEVTELLAHALVQAGELERARDLYKELAELESDPLHLQSYKQVIARLGQDSTTRPLSAEEGAQALMVDELEISAPAIQQQYSEEVALALKAALTDSELLDSYNLPAKAIVPLEAVLPSAPQDVALNQRLASLYARAERYSEAARCCDVLQSLYSAAGHANLASQYAEMAAKYHERAGEPVSQAPPVEAAPPVAAPGVAAEPAPAEVAPPAPSPAAEEQPATHTLEIDLSREWEEVAAAGIAPASPPEVSPVPTAQFLGHEAFKAGSAGDVVGDLLEEIRFYLSQSMWHEAGTAIEKCAALASDLPELAELRAQWEKSSATAAASEPEVELVEEEAGPEPTVSALVFEASELEPAQPPAPAPVPALTAEAIAEPVAPAPAPAAQPEPVMPLPAPDFAAHSDAALADLVLDLEKSLGDDFSIAATPPPVPAPPPSTPNVTVTTPDTIPAEPMPVPVVPAAAATVITPSSAPAPHSNSALAEIFDEFKEDLEDGTAQEQADPETHYNLGVAFKEMGLLDEAIGELQKVCRAIDAGYPFPQVVQAYTWLAQCLLDKGAPQAAIKWYQRALQLSSLDEETRTAIHYEVAAAYEAAGNPKAALDSFMEVYATNIDYRDVAERIKTLKS